MKFSHFAAAWPICSALGCVSLCAQDPAATTPTESPPSAAPAEPAPSAEDPAAIEKALVLTQAGEALSLLTAAERGDRSQAGRLAALLAALRADPRVPEYDRYVLVARASALEMKPPGKDRKAKFAAYAELARKLAEEFPDQAEPYASLLALAEDSSDMGAAGQLAIELMDSRAPDAIKAAASRILDREAMVGTPFDFAATDGMGRPLNLAQFRGRVVVLYVWTGRTAGSAAWVQKFLAEGNTQVVFVGLNLDPDSGAAQAQMARVAPESLQVYDAAGPDGPLAAPLHLTRCPAVYLIDREGILQDVHGLEHFTDKLAKLLGATRS